MKVILWDFAQTEDFVDFYVKKDTSIQLPKARHAAFMKVFALHKTDSVHFFTSFSYYKQRPTLFKQLMDSTFAYGTRQRDAFFNRAIAPMQSQSDSARKANMYKGK